MSRPSWDEVWLNVAEDVAEHSRCTRRQVGALAVGPDNRYVVPGYNGPPAGWPFDGPCDTWCPRAGVTREEACPGYSDCHAVHAEENALLYADRTRIEGGTLYVTTAICSGCAKPIANSGVAAVVVRDDPAFPLASHVERFLELCDIEVRTVEREAAGLQGVRTV